MRKILTGIIGIFISFIALNLVTFVLVNINGPFRKFTLGDFKEKEFLILLDKVNIMYRLIISPIPSFVTGLIVGLIAKEEEYLIAFISIVPFCLFVFIPRLDFVEALGIYLSTFSGVYFAKQLKRWITRGEMVSP